MRAVIDIFLRDLIARLRDRSAIVVAILAPLALIGVFSTLLTGTDDSTWPLGYVAQSPPTAVDRVLTGGVFPAVTSEKVVAITNYDSQDAGRTALEAKDVDAVIVSQPAGVGAPLGALVVERRSDSPIGGAIADSLANAAAGQMNAIVKLVAAERKLGVAQAGVDQQVLGERAAADLALQPVPLVLSDASEDAGGLSPKTLVAVGMATFFLFFTVQFGLLGLLQERREGTLARLLAAVTPRQIILAKLLVSFVLGVISMTVLFLVSRWLLGAHFGDTLGVAILIVCGVAAAPATVALVVGLAKTPEQAGLAQSMVALVLGILGGSFFSMARSGAVGAVATRLTPHFWFTEGLARMSGGSSWTAVLGPAAVLVLFTVVVGVPGLLVARRGVRP